MKGKLDPFSLFHMCIWQATCEIVRRHEDNTPESLTKVSANNLRCVVGNIECFDMKEVSLE